MIPGKQTVLLVSDSAEVCEAARRVLGDGRAGRRVASVRSLEAARRVVMDSPPDVIVLEESALHAEANSASGEKPRLDAAVSALAACAPVVVIASAGRQRELAALVAAGAADYAEQTGKFLATAAEMAERRLRQAQSGLVLQSCGPARPPGKFPLAGMPGAEVQDFGEVLRHELNNPLTGILGNAELLLAEVRRKNDGRLPNGGQQKLETIAALAVRLRETVRRLSQECEARAESAHSPAGK